MNKHLRRTIKLTVFVVAFCAALFISSETASAVVEIEKDGSVLASYGSFEQAVNAVNNNESIEAGDDIIFRESGGSYPGDAPAFTKRINLEIYGQRNVDEFHRDGDAVLNIRDAASLHIHDINIRCGVYIEDNNKDMEVTIDKVNVFKKLTVTGVRSCSIDGTNADGSRSIIQNLSIKGSSDNDIEVTKLRGIESEFRYPNGDETLPDYMTKSTEGYRLEHADCALIDNCQVINGWIQLDDAVVHTFTNARVIHQVDIFRDSPSFVAVALANSTIDLMENCTLVSYCGDANDVRGYAVLARGNKSSSSRAIGTMRGCYIYGGYSGIILSGGVSDIGTIDDCVIVGRQTAIDQTSSAFQFPSDVDCIKGDTVLFSIHGNPIQSGGNDIFEPNLTKTVGNVRVGTVRGGTVPGGDKSTWPEGYSWRNTNRNLSLLVTPDELSPYVRYDLTEFYYLSYDNCEVTYHEGAGSKKDGFDAHYQQVLPGGATYKVKAYDPDYIDVPNSSLLNVPMGWTEDVDGEGEVLYGGENSESFTIDRKNYDYYPKYKDGTTYKVVFDTGEYGSNVESQQVFRQSAPKTPEEPTHPGATFAGWYLDDQFTGEKYEFNRSISTLATQNNTVKLYAKWDLNEYTVTFNATANNGKEDREVKVKWGEKVERPVEEPEYYDPDVKSFSDWYKTASGKTKFNFDTVIKEDTTVYARFEYNKSTITIEMDGGTVGGLELPWKKNKDGNIVYKGEVTDRIPVPWGANTIPTKGYMYTYDGIYEDPEFNTESVAFEGDEFLVPATRSYYVRFAPKDYTVKYYDMSYADYQKDTSVRPIKEESLPYGSEITYESEDPERFGGWDPYYIYNSETIAVNNWDGTVLAHEMKLFRIDLPQIIYHSDVAGTKVMEKAYVKVGSSLADYGDRVVESEDYTFVGWTTTPRTDGEYHYKETLPDEGKNEADQENYPFVGFFDFENTTMPDEDIHLYPVLVRDRLRVRLNPNGGRMMAGQAVEFNVEINEKLEMRLINRTLNAGYALDGWYTGTGVKWNADWGVTPEYCDKDANGKPIRNEESDKNYHYYTIGLTAIWSPKDLDVCYKGLEPNADVLHKEGTVRLGDTIVLKDAVASLDGEVVFYGWRDNKTVLHSAGEEFLFDDAGLLDYYDRLIFTANYRTKLDNEHIIRFDTKGGSYVPPITLPEGDPVTAPDDPVREGYEFQGWYPEVPPTMPTGDVLCEAQWKKVVRQFTISFDTTGGGTIDPITADEGSELTPPSDPQREHYVFKGWTPAFPDVVPSKDMTLSATWEPAVYKVTFDANGGQFSDGKQQIDVTGIYNAVLVAPEEPVRDQYQFSGWESDVPAHIPGGDITIKATWTKTDSTPTISADDYINEMIKDIWNKVTLEDKEAVEAASAAYEALGDKQAEVSEETKAKLDVAVAKLAAAEAQKAADDAAAQAALDQQAADDAQQTAD